VSNFRLHIVVVFVAAFVGLTAGAQAANKNKKETPVRVSGSALHADLPKAEFCLSFSEPVLIKDRARLLTALDLRKAGKKQKISIDQLSLSDNDVCIQNLDHRATYKLLLSKLDTGAGDRLETPFATSFDVPDRKPVLTFVEDNRAFVLPRHMKTEDKKAADAHHIERGMAHVVRSVNVLATHLSLYRVAERADFVGAWQQFRMINIAPSESLYFAKRKGQLVFESDLVFGDVPNEDQTLVAPLPDEAGLTPGLYYLAATPRGNAGTDVTLFAGQWFLVSDLRVSAAKVSSGFKVFASQGLVNLQARPKVSSAVLAEDGKVLAEGTTEEDGSVFLPMEATVLNTAAFIVGQLPSGDVDILEIKPEQTVHTGDLSFKASVKADRDIYKPGMTSAVALLVQDQKGQALDIGESVVKLLYADRRPYSEHQVKTEKSGVTFLNIPLPVAGKAEAWIIAWYKKEGTPLGETTIRMSPDGVFGKLLLDFDRLSLSSDGPLTALVRAQDDSGKPLAFRNGVLAVTSAQPEIEGWTSYSFGDVTSEKGVRAQQIPFMTNEEGVVRVPVSLGLLTGHEADRFQGFSFEASLDTGITSSDRVVPVRARESLIGVRPLTEGRPFAENSVATFDVIAVDMAGKRRVENNLYYVVYEEGRNFDWFQAEGRWDYKPLPNHRRVGGGRLDIPASGDSLVQWPVTSGQYVLEITNAAGEVWARYPFAVGRGVESLLNAGDERLQFVHDEQTLEMKQDNKVKLELAAPAMVDVIVTDGQIRQTIHRFMKAGENEISVSPTEGWGNRVLVRAEAVFVGSPENAIASQMMNLHATAQDLTIKAAPPSLSTGRGDLALPVQIQKPQHGAQTFVSAIATPYPDGGGDTMPPLHSERVAVDGEGKAEIKINVPRFVGKLDVMLYAWNGSQAGATSLTLPVQPVLAVEAKVPPMLRVGDKINVAFTVTASNAPAGTYSYDITLPDGFSAFGALKGKLALKKNGTLILPLSLTAKEPADGALHINVKGPDSETLTQTWPIYVRTEQPGLWTMTSQTIEPNQSLVVPAATQKRQDKAVLVGPLPLPDLATPLQSLVLSEPRTTQEIARWLEVMPAWKSIAHHLGLLSQTRYETLRANRLFEIQLRQNEDGGFAELRAGDASNIASTAAALRVLSGVADRPFALGVEWLSSRLQNTWFDESEREERAVAFETLAKLKRVDISGLRYFAETSRDKTLHPSTSGLLALALVEGGDEGAAQYWIDQSRKAFEQGKAENSLDVWSLLKLMAANNKISFDEIKKALMGLDSSAINKSYDGAAAVLASIDTASSRVGSWQLDVDGVNEKRFGVLALPLSDGKDVALKNNASLQLSVVQFVQQDDKKKQGKAENALTIQRAVYTLAGERLEDGANLTLGETYVLYVKGSAAKSELRVMIPSSSAFGFSVPSTGTGSAIRTLYGWLPAPVGDMKDGLNTTTGFGFDLEANKEWGTAFLMRPLFEGEFNLPQLRMKTMAGLVPSNQNALRFVVE